MDVEKQMKGKDNCAEMPSGLEAWAEYLAKKALPLIESTTRYVNQLDNRSGRSVESICAKFLLDPGAVVTLLQQVNSLKRGRLSSEITTVENAIVLLGIEKSRQLLKRCKVIKLPAKAPALKQYIKQVNLAYHAGYLAHEWAMIRGSMVAKESFVQTFLFRIGEMYMWLYGLAEIAKVRNEAIKKRVPFRVAQHEIMGFDFRQLSAQMAKILNMPEMVQVCHDESNLEIPNIKAVHLASSWVSLASQSGLYTRNIRSCEKKIAELIAYTPEQATTMIHKILVEIADDTVIYQISPLARELPRTDVELPKNKPAVVLAKEANPQATLKFAAIVAPTPSAIIQAKKKPSASSETDSSAQEVESKGNIVDSSLRIEGKKKGLLSEEKPDYNPLTDKRTASEVLAELIVELTTGKLRSLPHQHLTALFLAKLKKALTLDHVIHCEVGAKGKNLRAIQFSDKETRTRLGKFWVDLTRDSVVTRLLKKSQSLWLSDTNREKLWPLLPTVVKGLINTKDFYMMTLVLNNGTHCLVYADRAVSDIELDEKTYKIFKKLCKLLGSNLESL
ncbi:hypothetical protein MNBD_GAMMA12-3639 [hydrothermal vent metagenome]|uniref:HDOD domain-containing protein n=1 Tax=hydrothermal vent metagenome TaxID=652676 RepID=A0A3B0Y981_9ZZZZ